VQSNKAEGSGELDDLKERPDELNARAEPVSPYLWGNTDDLPPSLHPQVCANNTTYPRPKHVPLVVQQYRSIVIKPDDSAVWSSNSLFGTDNDGATNVSFADFYGRTRCLGGGRHRTCAFHDTDNFVTNASPSVVNLLLKNVDAFNQEGAGVVYDLLAVCQPCPYGLELAAYIERTLETNHHSGTKGSIGVVRRVQPITDVWSSARIRLTTRVQGIHNSHIRTCYFVL